MSIHKDESSPFWFPGDSLLDAARPKGLPIGNLTSQFFANVLLNPVDHFIKETLRIPGYVRYADDLLLFGHSKAELWEIAERLENRFAEHRLRLHPQKTHVRPSHSGVLFLGMRVWADQKRLSQQTIRRFNRRRRKLQWQFANGEIDCNAVSTSITAWSSWAADANSSQIRKTLMRKFRLQRVSKQHRAKDK